VIFSETYCTRTWLAHQKVGQSESYQSFRWVPWGAIAGVRVPINLELSFDLIQPNLAQK